MSFAPGHRDAVIQQFGPHPAYSEGVRLETGVDPDKLVKTHCCFCGQQCGIQLKVKDNQVIGFQPWEDFPFNKGKLCPKGVKRYMQDEHPDRLRSPMQRLDGKGYEAIDWDTALSRVVSEIKRIQQAYGNDAFALLTGA